MTKTSHDSETLAQNQQVITVCALIHHNFDGVEKIFLPRRAATKKFLPSIYEIPGGHVDFGENLIDALKREIHEEFNKEITVGQVFAAFDYLNPVKKSHSVEIIYLAEFVGRIDDIKLDPDDHSEYIWMAEEDLPKILSKEKGNDDDEIIAIRRGFEIVKKESVA